MREAPELLCTLGPASLERRTIRRLEQSGATLFRVNLSHTRLAHLPSIIDAVHEATDVPLCVDTEGAQIRTGEFVDPTITLRDNVVVRVHFMRVPGDDKDFNLYPLDIARLLTIGDFVSIDFNSALAQVIAVDDTGVSMRVIQGGLVGRNKAVTVERDIPMPALTDKDEAAIDIARAHGVEHYALSFAATGENVRYLRSRVGEGAFVISKIESRSGLTNLQQIAQASDALLIDRGDLSRQVAIELLPQTQKSVIRQARSLGKPVYVATNLLESMVSTPNPTRAEVNDIYNTLADGADGLVLAAETAIGRYPIRCASMVSRIVRGFRQDALEGERFFYPVDPVSLLVEPHGGRLVHREATPEDLEGVVGLPRLTVDERTLMDCEQFAYGTYSPLEGFMDRDTLESVLESYRLPGGEVWTLPLLLQVSAEDARRLAPGARVALCDRGGTIRALLDVGEVYTYDLETLATRIFGTRNPSHPGVAALLTGGERFVGGAVTLVEPLPSPWRHFMLTPSQTRFVFTRMGWSQVVGFHSRNPAHRGHEAIQMEALERTGADGIYINPVIGPKKRGDFLPGPILLSYQTLLQFGVYPQGKVVLGSFFTYSRYAGPREAVFTALCRKNMGCSHFIVGRDHTGVGDFYPPHANRELFESLGDIGVTPVFFEAVGYDRETGKYGSDLGRPLMSISGTQLRDTLRAHRRLPDWFMRDLVQDVLLAEASSGISLFYD